MSLHILCHWYFNKTPPDQKKKTKPSFRSSKRVMGWWQRHRMKVKACQSFPAALPEVQSGRHHACVLNALFPRVPLEVSAVLLFMDANKLLTFSLTGFFLFLESNVWTAPGGSRRAASPQGCLLEGEGWVLSSCSKIHALSLAKSTNFCSWLWLTFLLMLRDVSKGFWM